MMNYQQFADLVSMPCCVMRVEKTPDGSCGEIRIVAANTRYRNVMGPGYRDGMLYSELVPKDNKFEDFCFHAAILGERMHAYVETRALGTWTDQTIIPLLSDEPDAGYCQFIFEFTQTADPDRMAAVSANTAESVIKACIRLMGTEDFKKGVGEAMDVIIDEAEAEGSRIVLIDKEQRKAVRFCERTDRSGDPITYDLVVSWEKMIGVSNAVIVKEEKDLESIERVNPVWAKSMRDNGLHSLVLIPLRSGKQVVGYFYVFNFNTDKTVEIKEFVELMAFFLGSEISNHVLMQKLDELSRVDVLTGMNNRRAMIVRVNEIAEDGSKPSYGVVNIDLNGLKTVNDNDGHDAGDLFLRKTGELLQTVFNKEDIFRTGGDEFIVINTGTDLDAFNRKVEKLRADAEKVGVSFAIGSFWSDGSLDTKTAFRYADEMMYADKNAFYDRHPELKQR